MLKRLDHIAVVVQNVEEAAIILQGMLGLELRDVELVEEQNVKVGFLPIGETRLELVEPTGSDNKLAKFLETRGPGLHHLCFEVDNIEKEMALLNSNGALFIDKSPRRGRMSRRWLSFILKQLVGF